MKLNSSNTGMQKQEGSKSFLNALKYTISVGAFAVLSGCGGGGGKKPETPIVDPIDKVSDTGLSLTGTFENTGCENVQVKILTEKSEELSFYVQQFGENPNECLITEDDKKVLEGMKKGTYVSIMVGDKTSILTLEEFLDKIVKTSELSYALSSVFGKDAENVIKVLKDGSIIIDLNKDGELDSIEMGRLLGGLKKVDDINTIDEQDLVNIVLAALSSVEGPSSIRLSNTQNPITVSTKVSYPQGTDKKFDFGLDEVTDFIKNNISITDDNANPIDIENIYLVDGGIGIDISISDDLASQFIGRSMGIYVSSPLLGGERQFSIDVVDSLKLESVTGNVLTAGTKDNKVKLIFNGDIGYTPQIIPGSLVDYKIDTIEGDTLDLLASPFDSNKGGREEVVILINSEEVIIPITIDGDISIIHESISVTHNTADITISLEDFGTFNNLSVVLEDSTNGTEYRVKFPEDGNLETLTHTFSFDKLPSSTSFNMYVNVIEVGVSGDKEKNIFVQDIHTNKAPNNSPVAVNDGIFNGEYGKSINITKDVLLGNDSDIDGDALDIISFENGRYGTVQMVGNIIIYTPNTGFSGKDYFSYTISDGNKGNASAIVNVNVGEELNLNPNAIEDYAVTDEGKTVIIDVLANDSDPEGEDIKITYYTQGNNGKVENNSGKFSYTPNEGFVGTDTFFYEISDTGNKKAYTNVTITVNEIKNISPTANAGLDRTTTVNESITIIGKGNDADGNIASYEWSLPNGTILSKSARVSYTPENVGVVYLTLKVTDNEEAVGYDTMKINVIEAVDRVAPVITLDGLNPMSIEQGTEYVEPGASCIDNKDKTCNVVITGAVDTSKVGQNTITYTATDAAGNTAIALTRTVNVTEAVDRVAPVITLDGLNPMSIEQGTEYVEPGASCIDNKDKTCNVEITGAVDTSKVGQNTITYTATDAAGNTAIALTRTVNVIDTRPPEVTLNGGSIVNIGQGTPYIDAGASCVDINGCTVVTTGVEQVDESVLGQYEIVYTATDLFGNSTSIVRIVNVVDLESPIINLDGDSIVDIEFGTPYIDAGASCVDINGCTVVTTGVEQVDESVLGQYEIVYTATDPSGNSTSVIRTVNVIDTTPPEIMLKGPETVTLFVGDVYDDEGAEAVDNVDGDLLVVVGGDSVDTNQVGTYTVTYNASDLSGNAAEEVERIVIVEPVVSNETVRYSNLLEVDQMAPFNNPENTVSSSILISPAYGSVNIDNTITTYTFNDTDPIDNTDTFTIEYTLINGNIVNITYVLDNLSPL